MSLNDSIVLDLRRIARDNPKFDRQASAKLHGVTLSMLTNALTGKTFKHLNGQEPPVIKIIKKADDQEKARQLYMDGKNYNEIVQLLGVAKSSVSYWCRDLAESRRAEKGGVRVRVPRGQENPVPPKPRSQYPSSLARDTEKRVKKVKKVRKPGKSLTDEEVIAIRKAVKAQGYGDLKSFAQRYGVSLSSISHAISGKNFSHLNEIEAPVVEKLARKHRWGKFRDKRTQENESMIQEAIRLRREDPVKWTYAALAKWASERTGRTYHSPHISRPMLTRDPTLRELEKLEPPKPRRQQAPSKKKPAGPRYVPQVRVTAPQPVVEDAEELDPELQRMLEEEERYEAAVAAGLIKVE